MFSNKLTTTKEVVSGNNSLLFFCVFYFKLQLLKLNGRQRMNSKKNLVNEKLKKEKLTSMSSLVNFEIFRSRKHFTAAHVRTRKRFLARVHSDVVYQLVFGFE